MLLRRMSYNVSALTTPLNRTPKTYPLAELAPGEGVWLPCSRFKANASGNPRHARFLLLPAVPQRECIVS